MESARTMKLQQGRYVCEDGVWYACVDVVKADGAPITDDARKALHLVEGRCVCKDGVWYRELAVESV